MRLVQPTTTNIGTATDDSEVSLYYNKSRTFKHLVGARNVALAFQHCLKLHNKNKKEKVRDKECPNEIKLYIFRVPSIQRGLCVLHIH
jgi:ABC-type thiamine transport system ATPase subunit